MTTQTPSAKAIAFAESWLGIEHEPRDWDVGIFGGDFAQVGGSFFNLIDDMGEPPRSESTRSNIQTELVHAFAELLDMFAGPEVQALLEERKRQNEKWGEQNHGLPVWILILTEEVGEAAEAVLKIREGKMTVEDFRTEIIHCGAVCVQILEYLERGKVSAE